MGGDFGGNLDITAIEVSLEVSLESSRYLIDSTHCNRYSAR